MALDLDALRARVDTVVIVVLENRSFDHMLGHLSYGPYDTGTGVDGLREPLDQEAYENLYTGRPYYPFEAKDGRLPADLPHEREEVAKQLAWSDVSGRYTMSGFVEAYYQFTTTNWTTTPEPMGFLRPSDVPITHFLATEFAVCDRWFAPLPTSTLPNRLMAWTGSTLVDHTGSILPPRQPTVLEWLDRHEVPWRVYHDGLSFFALLGEPRVLGPDFRDFDRLAYDVQHERRFPAVVFVEPTYGDAPHLGKGHPNDDHPPTPVAPGEQFLRLIYRALTSNPERWQKTVLIVTFDEHGGFFDHVAPLPVRYDPPADAEFSKPFVSTGPRVPGLVASPWIPPGTVHHAHMDHTSVLQLLGERFGGSTYSAEVEARKQQGITSVSRLLTLPEPRLEVPAVPTTPIRYEAVLEESQRPKTPQQELFEAAARELLRRNRAKVKTKFPGLWHWDAQRREAEG